METIQSVRIFIESLAVNSRKWSGVRKKFRYHEPNRSRASRIVYQHRICRQISDSASSFGSTDLRVSFAPEFRQARAQGQRYGRACRSDIEGYAFAPSSRSESSMVAIERGDGICQNFLRLLIISTMTMRGSGGVFFRGRERNRVSRVCTPLAGG